MHGYRYIKGVATLEVHEERCVGCGNCVVVCPHRLLSVNAGIVAVVDVDLCMECGACAQNCPDGAISVQPGVGCAVAILGAWMNRLLGKKFFSDCC